MHSGGCRRWFNAVRDTRTYEVLAVYTNNDPRPEIADQITGAGVAAGGQ